MLLEVFLGLASPLLAVRGGHRDISIEKLTTALTCMHW